MFFVSWIDIIAGKELALNIAEQGLIPGSAQSPPLEFIREDNKIQK